MTFVIRRWTTTAADPDRGCARRGRFDESTRLKSNVDAQGAVNVTPITSRLPGAYTGSVPIRRFGEASLDLAALLEAGFDEECMAFTSVWMHSRSSIADSSNLQDYVAPRRLDVRTCSASGTKFFDRDADGSRDPSEPGIPRFLIWADYDDDGVHDPGEPFSVTDNEGEYVIYDIQPPDGTYMLREKLVPRRRTTRAVATDWICSFPNDTTPGGSGSAPGGRFRCAWGPIDASADPNATDRDFGNWFPAQLTLEKVVEPAGDQGRFDLLVGQTVVLAGAGDGDSETVPPAGHVRRVGAAGGRHGRKRVHVERRLPSQRAGPGQAPGRRGLCRARPRRGRPGDVHVPQHPQRDAAATRDRHPQDRP